MEPWKFILRTGTIKDKHSRLDLSDISANLLIKHPDKANPIARRGRKVAGLTAHISKMAELPKELHTSVDSAFALEGEPLGVETVGANIGREP